MKNILLNGLVVSPTKTIEWYHNGELHREDGPAIERITGTKEWYQNGKLHREDGPAYEGGDGGTAWWQRGKLHREDGPAVETYDGFEFWYLDNVYYEDPVLYWFVLTQWKINKQKVND